MEERKIVHGVEPRTRNNKLDKHDSKGYLIVKPVKDSLSLNENENRMLVPVSD